MRLFTLSSILSLSAWLFTLSHVSCQQTSSENKKTQDHSTHPSQSLNPPKETIDEDKGNIQPLHEQPTPSLDLSPIDSEESDSMKAPTHRTGTSILDTRLRFLRKRRKRNLLDGTWFIGKETEVTVKGKQYTIIRPFLPKSADKYELKLMRKSPYFTSRYESRYEYWKRVNENETLISDAYRDPDHGKRVKNQAAKEYGLTHTDVDFFKQEIRNNQELESYFPKALKSKKQAVAVAEMYSDSFHTVEIKEKIVDLFENRLSWVVEGDNTLAIANLIKIPTFTQCLDQKSTGKIMGKLLKAFYSRLAGAKLVINFGEAVRKANGWKKFTDISNEGTKTYGEILEDQLPTRLTRKRKDSDLLHKYLSQYVPSYQEYTIRNKPTYIR